MAEEKKVTPIDSLFDKENIPESSFFKMKKIGDRIAGILVETQDKEARDGFEAQRVFSLRQPDGSILKFGVPFSKEYVIGRANTAKMGDLLGFEYMKDVPSSKGKSFAAAKSIEVFVKHIASTDEAF